MRRSTKFWTLVRIGWLEGSRRLILGIICLKPDRLPLPHFLQLLSFREYFTTSPLSPPSTILY